MKEKEMGRRREEGEEGHGVPEGRGAVAEPQKGTRRRVLGLHDR